MLEDGMLAFALLGAGWVLWLLVGLSVLSIAVTVERVLYMARDGSNTDALSKGMRTFLSTAEPAPFHATLGQVGGFEARVLQAGVEVASRGPSAAEEAMSAVATAERLKMERGLPILATVGSNAPFLGLFGTVLGIIKALRDLSMETAGANDAVIAGISEALVATAVGLLVAIPAVVLYNLLSRWVKQRMGRAEALSKQVVAILHPEVGAHG